MKTLLMVITLVSLVYGQSPTAETFGVKGLVTQLADPQIDEQKAQDLIDQLVNGLWRGSAARALARREARQFGRLHAFRRNDLQMGASSAASGATSAVSAPLVPGIFGFAIENGAITRTVSGTTSTLRVNPAGIICASAEAGPDCAQLWKRFSASFSFDSARGKAPDELVPYSNQLTEAAVRIRLTPERDPSLGPYDKDWRLYTSASQLVFLNEFNREMTRFRATKEAEDLEKQLFDDLSAAVKAKKPLAEIEKPVVAAYQAAEDLVSADAFVGKYLEYLKRDAAFYKYLENKPAASFEWAYNQPDVTTEAIGEVIPKGVRPPSLHTARFIYSQGICVGKLTSRLSPEELKSLDSTAAAGPSEKLVSKAHKIADVVDIPNCTNLKLTAEASSSWFAEALPGMKGHWRDIRTGGKVTFRLKDIPNFGAPALNFMGHVAYLHQAPLGIPFAVNDKTVNQPGTIGVFQTQLEFPTANKALRIPISFTWASRTELISESDVRASIGMSINFDSFFPPRQ